MLKIARAYLFAFLLLSGSVSIGCSSSHPPAATQTTAPPATTAASPAATAAASPAATTAGSPAASPTGDATTAAASPAGDATPGDSGGDDDAKILEGGDVLTHKDGGVAFNLPKGWKQEQKGDQLIATAPDEKIFLVFVVTDAKEVDAVATAMGEIVDETLNDVKVVTEVKTEEFNGLTQVWADGTGTFDGKNVNWDASIVVGAKKALAVLAMGEIEKNEDTVYAIYRSIKPAEGPTATGGDDKGGDDKGGDDKGGDDKGGDDKGGDK